ncbi:hypothetical protein MMC21_000128 [Puttea exsequens]|nr:hypothetical protein [Puttea exsequens]
MPDVNAKDSSGRTALHHAAAAGNVAAMATLLAKGAQINATDAAGATALRFSVETTQCVEVAIVHDAMMGSIDSLRRTALHYLHMTAKDADENLIESQMGAAIDSEINRSRDAYGKTLYKEHYIAVPRETDNSAFWLLRGQWETNTLDKNAKDSYGLSAVQILFAKKHGQHVFD